jgi:ElaB/YqjD/DUF883 family membrane-anchored ribosome-binding protein
MSDQPPEPDHQPEAPPSPTKNDPAEAIIAQAEAAVDRAQRELQRLRGRYAESREGVVEHLRRFRESPAGETWQHVRKLVRRHPGPSVIVAMLAGLFLGRFFRR